MLQRRLATIALTVVIACVTAEVFSLVVYYYQTGHLFYLWPKQYQAIPETARQRLTGDGLHPYFGPTHKAGYPFDIPEHLRPATGGPAADAPAERRLQTNNFGFVSLHDYPYTRRRDDEFVIGIFGGSVGVWFCQVGAHRLMADLERHAFFKGRTLVPLCFSHEGYKQPQQLLVLTYFLSIGQPFDLVVNIDGFNEVALSSMNDGHGLDISMPSFMHLDPLKNVIDQSTLTPEKLRSLAAISRDKEQLNALVDRIRANRVAIVNFVLDAWYQVLWNRYQAELATFSALPSNPSDNSVIQVTPTVRSRQGAALFEDIAAEWVRASILMKDLLSARGAGYFHFLQPNQYHTARRFSADEAKVALSNESPFKPGAEKGYPVITGERASAMLARNHVNFFDATRIFDDEPSPVYMDNCCHYTLKGNELLADFIAGSILRSKGAWNASS